MRGETRHKSIVTERLGQSSRAKGVQLGGRNISAKGGSKRRQDPGGSADP